MTQDLLLEKINFLEEHIKILEAQHRAVQDAWKSQIEANQELRERIVALEKERDSTVAALQAQLKVAREALFNWRIRA